MIAGVTDGVPSREADLRIPSWLEQIGCLDVISHDFTLARSTTFKGSGRCVAGLLHPAGSTSVHYVEFPGLESISNCRISAISSGRLHWAFLRLNATISIHDLIN